MRAFLFASNIPPPFQYPTPKGCPGHDLGAVGEPPGVLSGYASALKLTPFSPA